MPGTLFVVATPIGNLEDITVRALRVLREVAVIAAEDTRRTAQLLARHGIATPTTSLHEHNESRKSRTLVARLERGDSIALVSDAGTPTVSDPGAVLVRLAREAGCRVEPIPGPSAVLAALSVAGRSTETFSFHGFPPTRSKDRASWFRRVQRVGGTVVFFEAPHRIRETLSELQALAGDVVITVGRELTKKHEELVEGPISTLVCRLDEPKGEFTIVAEIGQSTESAAELELQGQETRRKTLAAVAKSYGISANDLYDAIELARHSVK
jgi:16S rRNA (cytidine1402-2'-O)-methyltransferase